MSAMPVHVGATLPLHAARPGEEMFAVESAMDELAHRLGMDPVRCRCATSPSATRAPGSPGCSRWVAAEVLGVPPESVEVRHGDTSFLSKNVAGTRRRLRLRAVANAAFHATGVRVRQLPITIEHLL
ncbi:MAG: hypothetical protein M3408_08645 [Actinomycetota bacterium]|nr:hypothetical protein [Actinomycetota bacterium]